MRIVVPENLGGDLRLLPPDTYSSEIQDIFLGESQAKQPKVTIKHVLTSEYGGPRDDDFQSCIGEVVLDSFSLQTQAMWRLNDLYKEATGEKLPMGDFSKEEFEAMLKEKLVGTRWNILVDTEEVPGGREQTKIQQFSLIPNRKLKK